MFSRSSSKPMGKSISRGSVDLSNEFIELEEGSPSVLSRGISIKGNIQKNGDLHMEGDLHGNMRARTVTIGSTAHIKGNISGEHVRCAGRVDGSITARVVELFSTARVQGDIIHETLAIEAGAKLEGLCRRGSDLVKDMDKASQAAGFSPLPSGKGIEKKGSRGILGGAFSSGSSNSNGGVVASKDKVPSSIEASK